MVSFTEFEKTCPSHTQNEENICICNRFGIEEEKIRLCNKSKCPEYRGGVKKYYG